MSEEQVVSQEPVSEEVVTEVSIDESPLIKAAMAFKAEQDEKVDDPLVEEKPEVKEVVKTAEKPSPTDENIPSLSDFEKKAIEAKESRKEVPVKEEEQPDWVELSKDPDSFFDKLEAIGVDIDDVSARLLEPKKESQPEDKVDMVLKKLEERENKDKEQIEKEAEQEVETFKGQIKDYVSQEKEQYPLLNSLGQQERVFDLIDGHFHNTGELLEVDFASKVIEKDIKENLISKKDDVRKELEELDKRASVLRGYIDSDAPQKKPVVEIKKETVPQEPAVTSELKESEPVVNDNDDLTYDERLSKAARLMQSVSFEY